MPGPVCLCPIAASATPYHHSHIRILLYIFHHAMQLLMGLTPATVHAMASLPVPNSNFC